MLSYKFKDSFIQIKIRAFILDAPARCATIGTKSHCAYSGCSKCNQEGIFLQNRMKFPDSDSMLRSNHSFRNRQDENYHNYKSEIKEFKFDVVENIPLEQNQSLIVQWVTNHMQLKRIPCPITRIIYKK